MCLCIIYIHHSHFVVCNLQIDRTHKSNLAFYAVDTFKMEANSRLILILETD